jgi:DNA-binding MarR family transcriptional regulator
MKIEEAIKQKKFNNSQEKAWINLIYTYNQLSGKLEELFKRFDLTHQQYNVLRILRGKHPESACCGAIKEVMLDKNPDLTRLCDRLLSKGLVDRFVNEENRRQVNVGITEKGLKLLEEMEPVMKEYNNIAENLTEEEANTLSDLLDKLRG